MPAPNINEVIAAAIEPVVEAVVNMERRLPEALSAAAINVSAAESSILAAVRHFAYE